MGDGYTVLEKYGNAILVGEWHCMNGFAAREFIIHDNSYYERGSIQAFDGKREQYLGMFCSLREYIQKGTDQ